MTELGDLRFSGNWQTGLIDEPLIKNAVAGLPAPIFYVAGPPRLVEAMRRTLNSAAINDDDIRSEDFYGY
jgi:hypothetical protein